VFIDVPANLSDLAMSESNWRKVATTFHLPSDLGKDLKRKTTKVSSTTHKITKARKEEGRQSSYVEHLEMHSMVTSDEIADNFALASTHFKKKGLTFIVILGASTSQMRRTKELLKQAEDAIDHPLLGLGLCAELQFERDKRTVENNVDECIKITTELERALQHQDEVGVQLINKVRERQFATAVIVEELRAIKNNMTRALPKHAKKEATEEAKEGETEEEVERIDDQEEQEDEPLKSRKTVKQAEDEATNRFHQRFKDILVEYDALEAKSQRHANNMSVTSDIVRWHILVKLLRNFVDRMIRSEQSLLAERQRSALCLRSSLCSIFP